MEVIGRWWAAPVVLVACMGLSFVVAGWRQGSPEVYAAASSGNERLLIVVASSGCAYSNAEELPAIFDEIKKSVAASAAAQSKRFVTVGIAKDIDASAGYEHLKRFGQFDEVIAGRSWLNLGALRYVFGQMPGRPSTPQVLVVDRTVQFDDAGATVSGEVLVRRRSGLTELRAWASEVARVR